MLGDCPGQIINEQADSPCLLKHRDAMYEVGQPWHCYTGAFGQRVAAEQSTLDIPKSEDAILEMTL